MSIKDAEAYLLLLTGKEYVIERDCHLQDLPCCRGGSGCDIHTVIRPGRGSKLRPLLYCPWMKRTAFWRHTGLDKVKDGDVILKMIREDLHE